MRSPDGASQQFSQSGGGRPIWLLTFADLISLLIAFFVMLFATQKVDLGKWHSLTEALSHKLNPTQSVLIARPSADRNINRLSPGWATDLDYLEAVIQDKTKLQPELAGLALRRYADRLVITLPAELLFQPGQAVLKQGARPILSALADMLGNIGNRVEVVGHADPQPLHNSPFASNWELSIARAVDVAAELRREGYDRATTPSGYGATDFSYLPADIEGRRRLAVARRVDLVIWPTRWRP